MSKPKLNDRQKKLLLGAFDMLERSTQVAKRLVNSEDDDAFEILVGQTEAMARLCHEIEKSLDFSTGAKKLLDRIESAKSVERKGLRLVRGGK